MSLYKTYKTNREKEKQGIEIQFEPNEDGSIPTFIVARQGGRGNKKFGEVMREIASPYQHKIDADKLDEEIGYSLTKTAFIRGCLRNWRHVKDEDGNDMPFTEENAEKLFQDLPDVFERLNSESQKLSNYKAHQLEDEAKN